MGLWKSFISYSCIFKKIFNAWRRGCLKFCWFSKIHFVYNFDRSRLFFDQSKLHLKISVSLCLVRLIEPVFRSIKHRESSFLKSVFDSFKTLFQKFFQLFSLSSTWQSKIFHFSSFPPNLLQHLPFPKSVSPFYPFFCILFHVCMHKFMHFFEISGLCINWDFF